MFVPKEDLFPSEEVRNKFGIKDKPKLLKGGLKRTFKAGNIVLKYEPSRLEEEAKWLSQLLDSVKSDEFRVQKFLKSSEGKYIEDGWVAYNYLSGSLVSGNLKSKKKILEAFHKKIKDVPLPPHMIEKVENPWTKADKMVWDEAPLDCHDRILSNIQKLIPLKKPLKLPSQLIHGDPNHILFSETENPALIDISWHWRPADYALAVLAVDHMVCWCKNSCECLTHLEVIETYEDIKHFPQLLIRAILRRSLELEGLRKYNKKFLGLIDNHVPAINYIYDYVRRIEEE